MSVGICWLIGGTSDSAAIARQLSALAIPYIVTVTTPSARKLYPANAQVWVGKLSPSLAEDFVRRYRVGCIADASHPFASEISGCAIALSQKHPIPYLRYERPTLANASDSKQNSSAASHAEHTLVSVDSIDSLVDSPLLENQRVLFTIGYRHLEKFVSLRPASKLYARVLPSSEAIAGAMAAGFSDKEIVALRPPISLALEIALWEQWNVSCVVAKASGQLVTPGTPSSARSRKTDQETDQTTDACSGEQIKRQAAHALGVRLILIDRPAIIYPYKTEDLEEIVDFCQENSI